jgi:hypothetical protein
MQYPSDAVDATDSRARLCPDALEDTPTGDEATMRRGKRHSAPVPSPTIAHHEPHRGAVIVFGSR